MKTVIQSSIWCVALSLVLLSQCFFQKVVLKPDHYAILPPEAVHVLKPCSRIPLPEFEDTWLPQESDIKAMERQFHKLQRMRSKTCCLLGARINDINLYFRQYVGIMVKGHKFIYINAFNVIDLDSTIQYKPVIICDGGDCCWGVVYDPDTERFFDLSFNGIA